mgnify:CR=1 FL=1
MIIGTISVRLKKGNSSGTDTSENPKPVVCFTVEAAKATKIKNAIRFVSNTIGKMIYAYWLFEHSGRNE